MPQFRYAPKNHFPSHKEMELGADFTFSALQHDPFLAREIGEDEDEGLTDEYKRLAEIKFGENEDTRPKMLAVLREKIQEEGRYEVPLRKAFLLKILRSGGFKAEDAMKVLESYVLQLNKYRDRYYKNACPTKIGSFVGENTHMILPHRDKFGRRVYIYRPGKWNPDSIVFDDVFCLGYMFSELISVEPKTQVAGVTVISDAGGFSFKALRNISLEDAKNSADFLQNSFPLWFHQFHVINAPSIFIMAYNLFKPFLAKEVKDRVTFHPDLASLHEHIDPEILPEDFGGKQPPFSGQQCYQSLLNMKPYFDEIKTFKVKTPTA